MFDVAKRHHWSLRGTRCSRVLLSRDLCAEHPLKHTKMIRLATVGSLDNMQHFRQLNKLVIRMGPISLSIVFPFLELPA